MLIWVSFDVFFFQAEDGIRDIGVTGVQTCALPISFTGLNRIPILMLGPLLHLAGEAFVPLVGGDPIGRRPVNFHVDALRAMGAEVEISADGIHARASRL